MQVGMKHSETLIAVESHFAELPGNHILARMSHEQTQQSLRARSDAGGSWAFERAAAVSHDWPSYQACEEIDLRCTAQDCVDEAAMESFPASDPPSYTLAHA